MGNKACFKAKDTNVDPRVERKDPALRNSRTLQSQMNESAMTGQMQLSGELS